MVFERKFTEKNQAVYAWERVIMGRRCVYFKAFLTQIFSGGYSNGDNSENWKGEVLKGLTIKPESPFFNQIIYNVRLCESGLEVVTDNAFRKWAFYAEFKTLFEARQQIIREFLVWVVT